MTTKWTQGALAALAVSLAPLAAQAADMAPIYKAPAMVDYQNWTGTYVGFNLGYGTGTSNWDAFAINPDPKGMIYGLTLGSNWQVGALVYGLEGDFALTDIKGTATCGAVACETKNTYLGTLRGRLGVSLGRLMPYVTGGAAFGDIRANNPALLSAEGTRFGWTIGAGLEYALLGNWSVKGEYLFVDLGKFGCGGCAPAGLDGVSLTANVLRLGVNYKFGGPFYSRW